MQNLIHISAEAKRSLLLEAPDIAANAVESARVGSRVGEALQDYASVHTLHTEAADGSQAATELKRIRAELVAEIRRALRRDSRKLGKKHEKE